MSISFRIPLSAFDGFLVLIEIGPKKLDGLISELDKVELTLDTSELADKLAAAIEFDSDRIEQAMHTVLIPLNSLRADFRMATDDFTRLLSDMIELQNEKWHKKHGEQWRDVAPKLKLLLAPNGYFALLSKTYQLLANRPAVAQQLKILTELRPVYDDELTATRAMVLTSTMVVHYDEAGESKCLHVTVDQSDLKALQEQLDRAEKKVQLLEEQAGRLEVPVLVAGAKRR